ncbi:MAG TPA: DUF5668 domain-containing protein [Chloroflexia bacterium]
MNTRHFRGNNIVGGVVLILLGAVLFAGTIQPFDLEWGNLWPVFLVVPGVGLLGLAFGMSKERRASVVMAGTTLLLLAIFFFAFTLERADWSEQATLWPLYVMIPGLAGLVAYLGSDMERPGYLMLGAVLSTVAGTLLVGTVTGSLARLAERLPAPGITDPAILYFLQTWWPAALLVAGFIPLAVSLVADTPSRRAIMVLVGAVPFMLGGFFLATTLGALSWGDQGRLWPVYLLIPGVAALAAYCASGFEDRRYLWAAIPTGLAGAVFLGLSLTGSYGLLGTLWPLYLIAAGLLLLVPRVLHSHR